MILDKIFPHKRKTWYANRQETFHLCLLKLSVLLICRVQKARSSVSCVSIRLGQHEILPASVLRLSHEHILGDRDEGGGEGSGDTLVVCMAEKTVDGTLA